MKEKDNKKLTVNPWRIIKIFLIAYLVFDKNGELYKTALEKCPLISKEEFCRRFPNIKM